MCQSDKQKECTGKQQANPYEEQRAIMDKLFTAQREKKGPVLKIIQ